ncbi:MAG TPA: hypothetical protein VHG08_25125 [Longimicrobium sp.]|nr:hypothetical protein [Longimicrobium sp.]
MNWTPDALDRLERAMANGARVQVRRRGTEMVLVPDRLRHDYGGEVLVALHLGTGDRVEVPLDDVEWFRVID